jgi:hypothetical protein
MAWFTEMGKRGMFRTFADASPLDREATDEMVYPPGDRGPTLFSVKRSDF